MSNEPLGIVEERGAARAKWGRYAYRAPMLMAPSRVAAPAPPPPPPPPIPTKPVIPPPPLGVLEGADAQPSIFDVQTAFVRALADTGYVTEGRPFHMDDLTSPRRSVALAWPRQVCMDLVRQICVRKSLPAIGKEFGKRDHTTVMHACKRAPEVLKLSPVLGAVHARVLADFGR